MRLFDLPCTRNRCSVSPATYISISSTSDWRLGIPSTQWLFCASSSSSSCSLGDSRKNELPQVEMDGGVLQRTCAFPAPPQPPPPPRRRPTALCRAKVGSQRRKQNGAPLGAPPLEEEDGSGRPPLRPSGRHSSKIAHTTRYLWGTFVLQSFSHRWQKRFRSWHRSHST